MEGKYSSYFDRKQKTLSDAVISDCKDMIYDYLGIMPYDEQVEAARKLYEQNIVDQKTGEGKTVSILLAALLILRDGHKLYISTANDYLAQRDHEYSYALLSELGYESVYIPDSIGITEREYEKGNIFYAASQAIIFDYLRGVKADYDFALLDEVDYTLVECAGNSYSVSDGDEKMFFPVTLYKMAKEIADQFEAVFVLGSTPKEDILFDYQYEGDVLVKTSERTVAITERGYEMIERISGSLISDPDFLEAFHATLTAKYIYQNGVEYIVEDGKVTVVDYYSGRKSLNSHYEAALHTAIEVKEGLDVTAKTVFSNTCSYTVFFSLFKSLSGISGTASYVPYDFNILYGKNTVKIKEHEKNRRKEIFEYVKTDEERIERIRDIASECDTPLLVVTDSDKRSRLIAERLSGINKEIIVLDNYNLEEEQNLLNHLRDRSSVLISGKIVGRGTDIAVSERFKGLTLVLSVRFPSERSERQIIGRTARNGREGTCYVITSEDDPIFKRSKTKNPKLSENVVKRIQKEFESVSFETRKVTYIINKLFHLQSEGVENALKSFEDTKKMLEFLGEGESNICMHITKHARRLLLHDYSVFKPWYQAQFLQYTYSMSNLLFSDDTFHQMNQVYIEMSKDVMRETIKAFLRQVGVLE